MKLILRKYQTEFDCTVGSYSEAAGLRYASLGFTEYDLSEPWVKEC